MNTDITRWLYS